MQEEAAPSTNQTQTRCFTVRALLLGLLGCLIVGGYAYFNDYGMRQTYLVGNHFPMSIYATFFAFLILVNPLLRWLNARFALLRWVRPFGAGELVVILSMALVTASLPTSGVMRYLPPNLVMPQNFGKGIADWERAQPLKYVREVNENLFPTPDDKGIVYDGYVQGLRKGKSLPPLSEKPLGEWLTRLGAGMWEHLLEIPFSAWVAPAKTWFPVLIIYFVFIIMMLRVVHRQWSVNEQLSYPIAEFANTLLKHSTNRFFSDVFYSRAFWIAFGAVLIYHIINGWHAYDNRMIQISLRWNLGGIFWSKLQWFHHSCGNFYAIYYGTIFLTVVAFAYFVPEEISFSLGISTAALMLVSSTSYALGHYVTAEEFRVGIYGSYVAMAAVIAYTGRYYYWNVLKAAFFVKPAEPGDSDAVWACRWFLLATLGFILALMSLGLDWLIATMCVLIIGVIFLVLARVVAETGVPFMQTGIWCKDVLYRLIGPAALGPAALYILQLVSAAFLWDNRECLSPFVTNGLRMGEKNGVRLAALSRVMMIALVIGLFAAGIGVLWVVYDQGALGDSYGGGAVPRQFAGEISREIQKLKRTGALEASTTVSGFGRFAPGVMDTMPNFWTFFLIGVGLVLFNSFLRLRYVWWPIHSVMFLFWGTWALSNFIWSFMLGWLIKVCVIRFGGGQFYQDLKPLFIGVILGDLSGGMLMMIFGTLRYCWTGSEPIPYAIFPT